MLNRQEIYRYLGVANSDSTIDAMIQRAEKAVIQAAQPKSVHQLISISVNQADGQVSLARTAIQSRDLANHLRGCTEGFLFACTLGTGVDALIKRYSITEMPMLPVAQAVSAAYVEYCVDQAQRELERYAQERGLYLRPRYSPGYGDFPLESQRFVFDALQISKKIGVSLTDSYLMIPFKSVTAVIGLSDDPSLCHVNKCMTCPSQNCPFRKDATQDD